MNIDTHAPGTFCWVELMTSDDQAARTFYTSLFGWDVRSIPLPDGATYNMWLKDGRVAGAMHREQNVPPNWNCYIAVESVDDAAKTARDLGANVMMEPFDVMEAGRMAVVADPQGAGFALWQGKGTPGIQVFGEPNTLCWNELMTTDVTAAREFYKGLFDWNLKVSDEYTEIHAGERPIGGMLPLPPTMTGVPPHWYPYFMVDDCDATVANAKSLGGRALADTHDIPNVGRFAPLADPQGAVFAVIRVA